MAHQLIKEVEVGDSFGGIYYVESVGIKTARNGNRYSDLMLRDKSGSSFVRFWGVDDNIKKGGWVEITANVEEYLGEPQIVTRSIFSVQKPDDLSDYMVESPTADEDLESFDICKDAILEIGKSEKDMTCSLWIEEVFANGKFFVKFIESPYGEHPVYGCGGGLLKRAARISEMANKLSDIYGLSEYEKMILYTASLLQSVGYVDAYEFEDCMPKKTLKGIMLQGVNLTNNRLSSALRRVIAANKEDVNVNTIQRLLHCVLAAESAEVEPITKEALLLDMICKMDNDLAYVFNYIDSDTNDEFTAYDTVTGKRFLK